MVAGLWAAGFLAAAQQALPWWTVSCLASVWAMAAYSQTPQAFLPRLCVSDGNRTAGPWGIAGRRRFLASAGPSTKLHG